MQSLGKIVVGAKMWCLFFFLTGRMARSDKLPVLNVLTGENRVSRPARFVAPIHVTLGRANGHVGPLGCAKFHLNRHREWECGPKISKISTFL